MTILQVIATQKNNSRRNTIKIKKKKRKNNPQTHNQSLVVMVSELIEIFQRIEYCVVFMCFVCLCGVCVPMCVTGAKL